MNRKLGTTLFFLILFLLPFIPVITSLMDIRNAIILDQPINWSENTREVIQIPEANFTHFEFRIESTEAKWEPTIKAKWVLIGKNNEVLRSSAEEGEEWVISRPLLNFVKSTDQVPHVLEIEFLNSNPEEHPVRLRVAQDRAVLLQKSERLFIVLLALSLGLMLVVLKPFWTTTRRVEFTDK